VTCPHAPEVPPESASVVSVLFVDDEPLLGQTFTRAVTSERPAWDVVTAMGVEEARTVLRTRRFHAVVSDITMPGANGLSLLSYVRERHPETLRVVHSGVVLDYAEHEELLLADLVFAKPVMPSEIVRAIDLLLMPPERPPSSRRIPPSR